MPLFLRTLVLVCLGLATTTRLTAQIYGDDYAGGIVPVDLCTCTTGAPVSTVQSGGSAASASLVYAIVDSEILAINPANGQQTFVASYPYGTNNLVLGPNGLLYSVGQTVDSSYLFSINPITGVVTELGGLPSDFGLQGDLFFFNGNLYALAVSGNSSVIAQIPVNDPFNVVVVHDYQLDFVGLFGAINILFNGTPTVVVYGEETSTGAFGLYTVNMTTGAYTPLCPGLQFGDLAAAPNAAVSSCCTADAGTFASLTPLTPCQNAAATQVHNGDEILPSGYELYFLLVNDPTPELPDDVLMVSDQPTFTFDPAILAVNTTYYIVALVAPAGPVYNASCLDLSAIVPVTWKPLPSVVLSVFNPDVCAGACTSVSATFTGTAPFFLTYSSPAGTSSQSFPTNNGSFQVCVSAGAAAGNFSVQATEVQDAFCTCN